jgi:hypothetical protein
MRTLLFLKSGRIVGVVAKASVEGVTILKAKVLRLPTPTQGYQPYTPRDIVLIGDNTQPVERRPLMSATW